MKYFAAFLLPVLLLLPSPIAAQAVDHQEAYRGLNAYRAQYGQSELTPHAQLEQAAEAKIDDMVAHQYWGHFGPNDEAPWDLIAAEGYQFVHAGENLAMGYKDSNSLIKGWIASQPHRENMLADYTHVGIASRYVEMDYRHGTLIVMMLAEPEPALTSRSSTILTYTSALSRSIISVQSLKLVTQFLR